MGGVSCAGGSVVKMTLEGAIISRSLQRAGEAAASAPVLSRRDGKRPEGLVEPIAQLRSNCPDDGFIDHCYGMLLELRSAAEAAPDQREGREQLRIGLTDLLEEMAGHHGSYNASVDSLLMRHWVEKRDGGVRPYDEHMKDHVDAIRSLFRSWTADRYRNGRTLKIFDASCGTGKVLEAFLDSLPPEMLSRVQVVANDLSSDALEAAKETLARFNDGGLKITFTRHDIMTDLPPGKFDVVMLSQTLPFIVDERALRDQRLQRSVPQEKRHLTAKGKAIEGLVKKLKPQTGEFLLIDEDPMKLSRTTDDFDGIIENTLFREIFRSVRKDTLIKDVMKKIGFAKFIGHLESFIDREHSMYLMAYTKNGSRRSQDDKEDELAIIRAMENMHPRLVERFQKFEGDGGTRYLPIGPVDGGQRLIIDRDFYGGRIKGNSFYWSKNGSNNLVVVNGLVHELGVEGYKSLIENLKRSKKAGPGASLLFIDKWPPSRSAQMRVSNSDARSLAMDAFDDHVFAAAYRSGSIYGYLYLIRDL
jgi:SAM-dependent methyltransferase